MSGPASAGSGARFARFVVVPEDLKRLHGPVQGAVTLPSRLYWSGSMVLNLDDEYWRVRLLEIVLRVALRIEDVEEFVNEGELRRRWGELRLPAYVRKAWEDAHPDLAAGRA